MCHGASGGGMPGGGMPPCMPGPAGGRAQAGTRSKHARKSMPGMQRNEWTAASPACTVNDMQGTHASLRTWRESAWRAAAALAPAGRLLARPRGKERVRPVDRRLVGTALRREQALRGRAVALTCAAVGGAWRRRSSVCQRQQAESNRAHHNRAASHAPASQHTKPQKQPDERADAPLVSFLYA